MVLDQIFISLALLVAPVYALKTLLNSQKRWASACHRRAVGAVGSRLETLPFGFSSLQGLCPPVPPQLRQADEHVPVREQVSHCQDSLFLCTSSLFLAFFRARPKLSYFHGAIPDLISPVRASRHLHPVVSFAPPRHAGRGPVPAAGAGVARVCKSSHGPAVGCLRSGRFVELSQKTCVCAVAEARGAACGPCCGWF